MKLSAAPPDAVFASSVTTTSTFRSGIFAIITEATVISKVVL
jgi:hypothetical protein